MRNIAILAGLLRGVSLHPVISWFIKETSGMLDENQVQNIQRVAGETWDSSRPRGL
jgi:hypothetical protein